MKIHCVYDKLFPVYDLRPDPLNPNFHSQSQVKWLAKILKVQGIRKPSIISNLNGLLVTGHGSIEAAKLNRWKWYPIVYQDFKDYDLQYAHMVADNGLAHQGELDFDMINLVLPQLNPDMGIEMLGIKDFEIDPSEKKRSKKSCPKCGHSF